MFRRYHNILLIISNLFKSTIINNPNYSIIFDLNHIQNSSYNIVSNLDNSYFNIIIENYKFAFSYGEFYYNKNIKHVSTDCLTKLIDYLNDNNLFSDNKNIYIDIKNLENSVKKASSFHTIYKIVTNINGSIRCFYYINTGGRLS